MMGIGKKLHIFNSNTPSSTPEKNDSGILIAQDKQSSSSLQKDTQKVTSNTSISSLFYKLTNHTPSSNISTYDHVSTQQKDHELKLIDDYNRKMKNLIQNNEKVFGLENFGSTCYMNSIIQCLFVIECFRDNILEAKNINEVHMTNSYSPLKQRVFTHNSLTSSSNRGNRVKIVNIDSVLNSLSVKIQADKIVIGKSSDMKVHSNDTRKKNALLKGPVINIDHLYPNYSSITSKMDEDDCKRMYFSIKQIFEIIYQSDSSTGVISPVEILNTLKQTNVMFKGGMHQDAEEFMGYLLNSINEYFSSSTNGSNFIKDNFQGKYKNTIKCLNCNNSKDTYEPFLSLQIPVTKNFKNLSKALNNLIESPNKEILKGENKFQCDNCNEKVKAERSVNIDEIPNVLILHLKRYEYSEKENTLTKLFNKMEYPLNLRIEKMNKNYELSGIVVHLGLDPTHGHYVAVVKNEKLGWLIYDDETVMGINENDVLKFYGSLENMSGAYVLIYKIKDNKSKSPSPNITESKFGRRGSILSLSKKSEMISQNQREYDSRLKAFIKNDDIKRQQNSKEVTSTDIRTPQSSSVKLSELNKSKIDSSIEKKNRFWKI
ncbi:uncharacterized protein HGUI_01224 [Hanseniaspora guilliermondii]|uniref:Ubiquitin carboxyl-terminal hydrolase n=1 Tax=Hanseniaspora guilliermondii TaxID=56406 RepID=A0A1L0AY73_9ASCO|nr:uncharacterized protein HGUI_01224 [Hanseniaspora guilliermondii]